MKRNKFNIKYLFIFVFALILVHPYHISAATDVYDCRYTSSAGSNYHLGIDKNYNVKRTSSEIRQYKNEDVNDYESLCNWSGTTYGCQYTKYADTKLKNYYDGKTGTDVCPAAVVIVHKDGSKADAKTYQVYAFKTKSAAQTFTKNVSDYDVLNFQKVTNKKTKEIEYSEDAKKTREKASTVDLSDYEDANISSCETALGDSTVEFLQKLFNYIKVLGPILVLILSSLDFTKTVLSGDEDSMKKAQKNLGVRLICAVGLYFLPLIVTLIINLIFGTSGDQICGIK